MSYRVGRDHPAQNLGKAMPASLLVCVFLFFLCGLVCVSICGLRCLSSCAICVLLVSGCGAFRFDACFFVLCAWQCVVFSACCVRLFMLRAECLPTARAAFFS